MKHLSLLLLLILTSCSFSKPVSSDNNSSPTENSKPMESSVPKSDQERIFKAIRSRSIEEVTMVLQSHQFQDFNFKDINDQTPSDLVIELEDVDLLSLFLKYGLSIYSSSNEHLQTLIDRDHHIAETYINRFLNPSMNTMGNSEAPWYAIHDKNIIYLLSAIGRDDFATALTFYKSLSISCSFLTQTLILKSQAMENRPSSHALVNFLKKSNCQDSLSSFELKKLYDLEARKQTQEKFQDPDLLLSFLGSSKLLNPMIEFSNGELKVSPWLLLNLASKCEFRDDDNNAVPPAQDIYPDCSTVPTNNNKISSLTSCAELSDPTECLNDKVKLNFFDFDFVILVKNQRVIAIKESEITDTLRSNIFSQSFGFYDKESWNESLNSLTYPDYRSRPAIVPDPVISDSDIKESITPALDKIRRASPKERISVFKKFTEDFEKKFVATTTSKNDSNSTRDGELIHNDIYFNESEYETLNSILKDMLEALKDSPTVTNLDCISFKRTLSQSSGTSIYQMSTRNVPKATLLAYDFIRALCIEPTKE